MALKLAKNVFAVIPAQFEEEETVQSVSFKTASAASAFAQGLQKSAVALYCKVNKITDKDAKKEAAEKVKVCLDVLLQPIDDEGQPIGDPGIFEQVR